MNAMKKFGFSDLPCGFIIGRAELVDVKQYKNEQEHQKDATLHLASSEWGNYGFVLANPQRIEKIPATGSLGFWEFSLK